MRVALFTNMLAPYRRPLFDAIGAGVDLHVIVSSPMESDRLWQPDTGRPGDAFTTHILPGRELRLPGGLTHINTGVGRLLRLLQPDVVICSSFGPVSATAAAGARRLGLPVVTWSEATPHSESEAGPARRIWRRLLARVSSAFVASGTEAHEYLLQLGVQSERIFLGVDAIAAPEPPLAAEVAACRERCRGTVVLYSGALNAQKNVTALIKEFARVGHRHEATLVLMGSGPLEAECRALASRVGLRNVVFTGFCNEHDKWAWYHAADLFVLPTLIDRWGLVINEAMLAGLPVVCSRYAGAAADLVRGGETGLVVDPLVPGQIGCALEHLVGDPGSRARMSHAAKAHIARFSIARSAAGFLDAIASVTQEGVWKAA